MMKIATKILAAVLISCAMCSSVMARGFYVAVDAADVIYSNTKALSVSGSDFNNAGTVIIGAGYNFNQHLGLEAGYSTIGGRSNVSSATWFNLNNNSNEVLKSSFTKFAAVGILPLNGDFGLFGKLGLAKTKIDYSNPDVGLSASGSKTNVMFGIGVESYSREPLGIRFQYDNFGKTKVGPIVSNGVAPAGTGGDIGMTIVSVGVVYHF